MPAQPDEGNDEGDDPAFGLIADLAQARELAKDEDLPPAIRDAAQGVADRAADELRKHR
ncbi:hypothetical protein [Streptomyces sp. DW26H14]|uniref:hypothetical protein n=1 Tax=Streptomyces sp. DW26H14 TaxID=3435395 RepID=UPI00403DD12F